MDKPISKKTHKAVYKKILYTVLACGLAGAGYAGIYTSSTSGKTYNVSTKNLVISTVSQAQFTEYLPLRGIVEPEDTIFIDAIDGGRVEEIYIQEGAIVEKGQAILKLSNTNLQLNVLAREAEVSEQINNMRNTRLALEQNQLKLKRDVIELDFEVLKLEKELTRNKALITKKLISTQTFETIEDELAFQLKYRETVAKSAKRSFITNSATYTVSAKH